MIPKDAVINKYKKVITRQSIGYIIKYKWYFKIPSEIINLDYISLEHVADPRSDPKRKSKRLK